MLIKKALLLIVSFFVVGLSFASPYPTYKQQDHVRGYYKRDGEYVNPYYRSRQNRYEDYEQNF